MRDGSRPGSTRTARIVEVEAYIGEEDLASHARFGRTARNEVMYGRPGTAYVYLVYGMHHLLNVVTEPPGRPAALLIRAVEPLSGIDAMRAARTSSARARRRNAAAADREAEAAIRVPAQRLAAGPALVTACFGLDRLLTGADLLDPNASVRIEAAPLEEPRTIETSTRIGVAYAGDWAARPWRFTLAGSPSLSRPPRRTSGRA